MLLYIIRHGEPDYKTDTLTELGVKQAQVLSQRFAEIKFDKIFSSPLGRAKQTAMPTCKLQNIDFEELPWLSENKAYDANVCDFNGRKDWWFSVQNTDYLTPEDADRFRTKDSEIFCNSTAREFDNFLSEIGYKKIDKGYHITESKYNRIAFFCHDGISKVLLSYALSIPFHIFCASFSIPHTGVCVLEFANNENKITAPRCLMLSDLSHLRYANMKNIYNNRFDV